jgi:hypothetical protein
MSEVNTYNIHVHQGEDWSMTLTIKDENNVAKNITYYTGKMEIRDKPGGTVYQTLATTPGTGMTITGVSGLISLSMAKTVTAVLNIRKAVYDLFIFSGSGTATPLLKGDVTVTARVTQCD